MFFTDLHTHLLPEVDDGSDSWETTMEMLRQGYADGIRQVVCTPHMMSRKDFDQEEFIIARYEELLQQARAAKIDITIHLGSELYIQPDIDFSRRIATYADNRRYFLVEFPMNLIPDFVAKTFFDCVLHDQVPLVAHPERYSRIITEPAKAFEFVERGAVLQINAGSLLGIFGLTVKNTAFQLMDHDLVGLVASDAHDLQARPLKLKAAHDLVVERWGVERAKRLFYENPQRILKGQDLAVSEPSQPGKRQDEKNGLMGSLLKRAGIIK